MASEMKNLQPSVGTILKIGVTADIGNELHLSDVDFVCTFYSDMAIRKSVVVAKEDMVKVDDDNYFAIVNTEIVGVGNYYCRLEVDIPDSDIESGIRKEVVCFPVEGCKVVK